LPAGLRPHDGNLPPQLQQQLLLLLLLQQHLQRRL
jgi:hypothetical protein